VSQPPVHEKLIRDGIPALAAADGRTLALRSADPSEMARLLGLKLVEETHEVLDAIRVGRPQDLLDELADLQTVVDELARLQGLTKQAIEQRDVAEIRDAGLGGMACDRSQRHQAGAIQQREMQQGGRAPHPALSHYRLVGAGADVDDGRYVPNDAGPLSSSLLLS
jgi:predicted house-cleaning noncanonical NTP pyrophosphatase (MazG superfamily)